LTHDNRVDDGSKEHFAELEAKYSNLTFVEHTHEDTVVYLRKLMDHYEQRGIFSNILPKLKENLDKFERKELFDHSKTFLWLSSGMLYNKAIAASKGDVILVGPADFSYLFRLKDLEAHAKGRARNGHFYGKPNALWARLTNQNKEWLEKLTDEVYRGVGRENELYRWDSRELFKDYLQYPPKLEDFYIPDFRNNKLISWADPDCMTALQTYCVESMTKGGVQNIPGFHGVHVMTRATYDAIGGFTEEFYGRALADDKMTSLGRRFGGAALPSQFGFAWTFPGELLPTHGQGYPDGWQELAKERDPYYGKHPIPPHDTPVYLHDGILPAHEIAALANSLTIIGVVYFLRLLCNDYGIPDIKRW
jgi:hypothetical protein